MNEIDITSGLLFLTPRTTRLRVTGSVTCVLGAAGLPLAPPPNKNGLLSFHAEALRSGLAQVRDLE